MVIVTYWGKDVKGYDPRSCSEHSPPAVARFLLVVDPTSFQIPPWTLSDSSLHDIETAEYNALIVKRLKEKGRPIPTNDIWIASNAMKHGLALYSFDSHFDEIDGIVLLAGIVDRTGE